MCNFTTAELDAMRKKHLYRITNGAWNKSGVNHPDNVGYLISHIENLQPQTYEEWETYFYRNIANQEKLLKYAERFSGFVFADDDLMETYNYHHLGIEVFCEMVVCRLIYETWLGYFAEKETSRMLIEKLKEDGYSVVLKHLEPKDDNKYAVDYLLYYKNKLICGIQIKSENYHKSSQPIVQNTIKTNLKKNEKFSEKYGVPVLYVYYKTVDSATYKLTDDSAVNDIEKLLNV